MAHPYYIYDLNKFKSNITELKDAVNRHYPNFNIGYSVKTNNFYKYLLCVVDGGEYLEVVSRNELHLAHRCSARKVIYNGVFYDPLFKIELASQGSIVNVDSIEELEEIAEIAVESINIGVRLNFDICNGIDSRFGIDVENEDVMRRLSRVCNESILRVKYLHCHFSQARSLIFFEKRIQKMIEYAKMFGAEIIDVGGNMYGNMTDHFKSQFSGKIPSIDDYGRLLGKAMAQAFPQEEVKLIVETGTLAVSDTMHLVSNVMNVKTIRGKTYIDLDVRKEDVGASCYTRIPTHHYLGKKGNFVEHSKVVGCSCVETDVIINDYTGYADRGGRIVFQNIGAYSNNMASNFIVDRIHDYVSIDKISDEIREKLE